MRLFIATSFPVAVMSELNARVAAVKPKLGQASWVRPETQHLTFAFLGEQEESMVERISSPLEEHLGSVPRFQARLRGAGFFPNPRRARVGWVGLSPEEDFVHVASAVRDVVTANGIELDGAQFKPHLTLMRIRDPWPRACIETFEKALTESIEEVLSTLKEREAKILRLYFGLDDQEPMTLEEIGSLLGITRERVRQIKEKALSRLRHVSRARALEELTEQARQLGANAVGVGVAVERPTRGVA